MSVNENPPAVSEAAKAKADELMEAGTGAYRTAFAQFIQQVSDAAKVAQDNYGEAAPRKILAPFILPEPVDPLLIEARELAAELTADREYWGAWRPEDFLSGKHDNSPSIRQLVAALRRGVELGKAST